MNFAAIEKIIDDIVGFVKDFAAKLRLFIEGFKTDVDFVIPE